jgi:hypothetical protein
MVNVKPQQRHSYDNDEHGTNLTTKIVAPQCPLNWPWPPHTLMSCQCDIEG